MNIYSPCFSGEESLYRECKIQYTGNSSLMHSTITQKKICCCLLVILSPCYWLLLPGKLSLSVCFPVWWLLRNSRGLDGWFSTDLLWNRMNIMSRWCFLMPSLFIIANCLAHVQGTTRCENRRPGSLYHSEPLGLFPLPIQMSQRKMETKWLFVTIYGGQGIVFLLSLAITSLWKHTHLQSDFTLFNIW